MGHCTILVYVTAPTSGSDLLTAKEAEKVLGKSSRTIRRQVERGKIPVAHKLPGKTGGYLFSRAVIELLAQRGVS